MTMPGRTYSQTTTGYRYGFNGQEKSSDVTAGNYTAEFWEYDSRVARRWNVDPLASKFPGQSPYAAMDNNPINIVDPTGQSGEPVIDKVNKTITVTSNITFYGAVGTTALATKSAANIQSQWNAVAGKVCMDGIEYSVKFVVTGTYDAKLKATDISSNKDIKTNYIKIVETGIDVSYMDAAGSNTGVFLKKNIEDANSTTETHEFGHGYGLEHPTDTDLRTKGKPSLMYPRGTAVDKEYTYDPTKGPTAVDPTTGARTNTMNPTTRKVTQTDIDNLGLDKMKYDSKTGKGELGKQTNTSHL